MPRPRPPHLTRETTRHGTLVWYVRRGQGPRIRLRAAYDTPAFWAEYRAAIETAAKPRAAPSAKSLAAAIERYRKSSDWTRLAAATRKQRGAFLQRAGETAGHEPIRSIDTEAIREGREARADKPHAANNFLKAMRGLFRWALSIDLVDTDPTREVKLLKGPNDKVGFHTWTEAEVKLFEARWPVGTRQRLALDLLLYTGLRRGDAIRLGRQHLAGGLFTLRMEKTGDAVQLPLLEPLARSIEATMTGDLTYLVTERGRVWSKESFGTWFRKACQAAKVPGSAHGLRKAGATRAAENGATERQLMAIYGWRTGKMAVLYTRAAEHKRLAESAMPLLLPDQKRNEKNPHRSPGAGSKTKKPNKIKAQS